MPATARILGASALLLAGLPAGAGATVLLDDFEFGQHSRIAPPTGAVCQWALQPHTFTGQRCTSLGPNVNGSMVSAIQTGATDDAIRVEFFSPGDDDLGTFDVFWSLPGVGSFDLHQGQGDRIVVRFGDALDLFDGEVRLTASLRIEDVHGASVTSPELDVVPNSERSFPLSAFSGVDTYRTEAVHVIVHGGDGDLCQIRDVRTARSNAWLQAFALGQITTAWPLPSPPCDWTIRDPANPAVTLQRLQISFLDVVNLGGAPSPEVSLTAAVDGTASEAQMFWTPWSSFDSPRFSMLVRQLPGSDSFAELAAGLPEVTQSSPQSFALIVPVAHTDRSHTVVGNSFQEHFFTIDERQSLRFEDVVVEPAPASLRGGEGGEAFVVSFTLEVDTGFEPDWPLWSASLSEDYAPGPLPTGASGPAASYATRSALRAVPGITRAGTRFVLERPALEGAGVQVFNVTGRRVRTLGIPTGASGISWDGDGVAGEPVAGGVYFGRLVGSSTAGTARVVLVR